MKLFGVSLGEGNTKVGEVFTFSLPSKTTCPGASSWCLKHCYAHRYEQIRPTCRNAYEANLDLANDPMEFERTMIGILPRIMEAFRIHVSGDFHVSTYIQSWWRICQAFPQTEFWTYTRSWSVEELREPLERLRRLENVEVFASVDPSMPLPPDGWRVAFLDTDPRASGFRCRAQTDERDSCLDCRCCFRGRKGNVIFKVH